MVDADGCATAIAVGPFDAARSRAIRDTPPARAGEPAGPGFEIRGEYKALLELAIGESRPCAEKIIAAINRMPRKDAERAISSIQVSAGAVSRPPLLPPSVVNSTEHDAALEAKILSDVADEELSRTPQRIHCGAPGCLRP
jgi:hypothetical protein